MTNDPEGFTRFIRILGRGPNLSRPLTRDEARQAMTMILDGDVADVQLGAVLMLLRFRTETPEELAGFVDAARARIEVPEGLETPDLDWPSYADIHKQMPWFVLSALLLAKNGIKVAMHGIAGKGGEYVTTRDALAVMGVTPCKDLSEAAERLGAENFAYLPLENIAPDLQRLFDLRPLFGLRSPVNSLARELNPLNAAAQLQGVFHPNYRDLHEGTSLLLSQPKAAIFKGGGGEAQRNPDKACAAMTIENGMASEVVWPAITDQTFKWREEERDANRIKALWEGELKHPVAEAAVTGTAAVALMLLGRVESQAEAEEMAKGMWEDRT